MHIKNIFARFKLVWCTALVLCLCCCFAMATFATDETVPTDTEIVQETETVGEDTSSDSTDTVETTEPTQTITYDVMVDGNNIGVTVNETNNQSTNVFTLLDTAVTDGLKTVVTNLIGTYEPRTYTVTTYLPSGATVESVEVVAGLGGLDWPWIGSFVLFALLLYSFLRIVGVLLNG